VGEIGIDREVFLHHLTWWEINSIIRGYRKRNRLLHQLMAENVFSTIYMMRDSQGKKPEDLFPSLFDDDEYEEPEPMTEDERKQLLAEAAAWQEQLRQEQQSGKA
jgi:hypothetical protein